MVYVCEYPSPLGQMFLAAEEGGLIGAWFEEQKYFGASLPAELVYKESPILLDTVDWLDTYFSGVRPDATPPLHPRGTPFRQNVWALLSRVPYGQTVTYGALAQTLAEKRGTTRVSAQAVGNAVGHNPISILIPCHRVVGADGSLTGYAGGLEKKEFLLRLDQP